jgi:phosphoribulokinase
MAERGHSLDTIKKSIAARKPDFDAYIDPQKKYADVVIQVRGRGGQRTREWERCLV